MNTHVAVIGKDPSFFEIVQRALEPQYSCSFAEWGNISSLKSQVILSDGDSDESAYSPTQNSLMQIAGHPIWLVACSDFCEGNLIRALEAGADDLISKSCSPRELRARIQARLRRFTPALGDPTVELGELKLDPKTYEVTVSGNSVKMSVLEFGILKLLAAHPKIVFSRNDLLSRIWKDAQVHARTVDTHIALIRKKLPPFDYEIHTIYGAGYSIVPRV